MHAQTDVVGAVVGDEVHFYFRTKDRGLYRVTREAKVKDPYRGAKLTMPARVELAPSLVAIASEVRDRLELLAITTEGELLGARPLATARTSPAWTPLPPIDKGVQASTSPAALAAVVLYEDIREPDVPRKYFTTELRVIGDDGQLHQVTTDDLDPERPWRRDWKHVDAIERDQNVLAIGAIANMPLGVFGSALQLGSAWSVVGTERATTLQDAITVVAYIYWHDHVRMSRRAPLPGSAALAELASSVGGDGALVAGTMRGAGPPFSVALFGSSDGASTFESTVLPSHLDVPGVTTSLLQPIVRYAGRQYHLAALERALPSDCVERDGEPRRITYRRAGNAAALAALQPDEDPDDADDYFIVRSGSEYSDNVTLAVTEGDFGTTAHVVYNSSSPRDLVYWRLAARATKPVEVMFGGELGQHDMPDGPPVLATGLAETVYVATADANRFEVCQLPAEGAVTDESCSDLSAVARIDPRELYFGAPREQPYGVCAGDAAPYYACLRDDRPFSIAIDRGAYRNPANAPLAPLEPRNHRVIVAYQGVAPSAPTGASTSIWLTVAPGGAAIGGWTAPIEISRREPNDTRHFFDPEVTIDERHRVSVTYSAIDALPAHDQRVQVYVAQTEIDWDGNLLMLDYGVPGSDIHRSELGSWSPEGLPFDCLSGRAALGAYRESDTIDARALHVLRAGDGHDVLWLSQFGRE
jgi:hypothetical protein